MSGCEVRSFRRGDREQLTALVNAHVQAVVPGVAVSVNAVLSQLEREPGEFIVDAWVDDRVTLVAEQRGRIMAAAHVRRYGAGTEVGEDYRGAGEIAWLVCWSEAPYWPDSAAAGDAVAAAAVTYLDRAGAGRVYADGALPAPAVYGLPAQWPHIQAILRRAGFAVGDRTEIVFLADVDALDTPAPPIPGLTVTRTLGVNGTRLSALLDSRTIGYVEVEHRLGDTGRIPRHEGWADVGNLHVDEAYRRQRIGSWLLGQAAAWLRLGHADRLLDYATPDQGDYIRFLHHAGFVELTRTTRGWQLRNRP